MASESTIGAGAVVRGSVSGDGDLYIHGRVEGTVAVSGELLIAETALIRSDISARRVVIHGAVLGNVSADEAIVLEPGARVVGDLGAPQIGIRPGGFVRGNVSTAGPLHAGAPALADASARGRPSPKVASAPTPPSKGAPQVGRAAAAPAAVRLATPPARGVAARPAPAPAVRVAPRPAPAERSAAAPANARPEPAATQAAPSSRSDGESSSHSGAGSVPPARTDTVPSTSFTASHAPGRQAALTESDIDELDDASTATSVGDLDEMGGPPPPVVPALRKGAKASLRRKGTR
jgi:cytoskeletal protein CcmA (bactofilin family)